ncbi:MFS transporter [Longispora albida]|uniref:MFS transporter n=1 Tax=Longispora albida TaxID=203523 RepID=UPI0003747775|nr:MFS transporter [Longispora albida]
MKRHRWLPDLSPLIEHRDYRLVFSARSVTFLGGMITHTTVPYQVYEMTGSVLAVGFMGLCELVPLLFMAFVGGALADYIDRRKLVLFSELAFTVLTALLIVNAVWLRELWLLYVFAALTAAVFGIQRPALDSLFPRLVPAGQLPAAISLNSAMINTGMLAGPALAGLLIATVPLGWVYAFDLATYVISLGCLLMVRAVAPPESADRPSLRSVVTGLRYAKNRQELLGTYLVDMNAMFFGMPTALYPALAAKLGGPGVLGLLYSAPALGALVASLTSRWAERVHRHGLAVAVAAACWGLAIVGFGLSDWLWLALVFLALAGAADMISGLFRGTIWGQTIPDRLRGRLAGIEVISYSSGPTLGQVESGLAAKLFGLTGSVVSGGLLCVAGTIVISALLPKFVSYDNREGIARREAEEAEYAAAGSST